MSMNFYEKTEEIKKIFSFCATPDEKYEKIIQLGRELPSFDSALRIQENLVPGCQSQLFLTSQLLDSKIHFKVWSDALISAGLAHLLLSAYDNCLPETILKQPPKFLEELGLPSLLSPSRSNGLRSLHLKMQQHALKYLR